MILNKIWERHLFYQILKTIVLFVIVFYLLYSLIDYSIHAKQFAKTGTLSFLNVAHYYLCIFIKRLDIILCLAFVIGLNKVLLGLNERRELISLLVGGLTKNLLLRPLILIAFLIFSTLLINFEYLLPKALHYVENFENQNLKRNKKKGYKKTKTYTLSVKDGGKLIFSKYNPEIYRFDDVYYIVSINEVWKIKTLIAKPSFTEGFFVDHLIRNEKNQMILNNYQERKIFSDLEIDFLMQKKGEVFYEQESLSSLYQMMTKNRIFYEKDLSKIRSHLFFKIGVSFISFLIIIACTPFCIVFTRKLPIFMIYAMSIFGMITFFTMMDAAVILGESRTVPSLIGTLAPFLIALTLFSPQFVKSCKN